MQEEIWRKITGYEQFYEVSNQGHVRRLKNRMQYKAFDLLTPTKDSHGYLMVRLCVNGVVKSFLLHRLVAIHFIDNPSNMPEVNHLDGNKTNCAATNLEWCDRKQNQKHARINGLYKTKAVEQCDHLGAILKTYQSLREACEAIDGKKSSLSNCCLGRTKTYKGYKWRYKQ